MARIIPFEKHAVAQLRERLGQAQEANEDLIAFARGHSDAVASIHAAALAAIEAPSVEALLEVMTRQWPAILGIDSVAVALVVAKRGFRADCGGIEPVDPVFVERLIGDVRCVEVRSVSNGHPLFGRGVSRRIRAEALIPIEADAGFPRGLVVFGQRAELTLDSSHGTELLRFLGRVVAATFRRLATAS